MAIQVGLPQTSQDLINLHACAVAAFPHSCFHPPQKQPQQYFSDPLMHPDMLHPNLLVSASKSNNDLDINHPPSLPTFQTSALQFVNHDHEIDHYIKLQGEKLSIKLQEQRKQQLATILNAVDLSMLTSLGQKDEEIARAAKKRTELEYLLNRVEAENQAWRRAALESEAMILSLNNSLEKMKETAYCSFNNVWADEAQSCWDESGRDYKQMEEEAKDDDEQKGREMAAFACKSCNCAMACFLFLPCRHLCACKACEPFLQACPVCTMPKKASLEALIF
ncbi:probable BOI-related E3 ubiquitin-protein ligase 2 [Neltuma alba]|uniref:probable BOI-related E3 ubiquitin-protein ligase 2 n=1 Tax=Neltuma alba TaxID=207710 RepID=UPI0010A4495F|nr:probable BOI-related E3 ubiquitin-protein ligase 2 [Prosopis alba]